MPDDKDKAVLAARVLSYLKRKFGHGPQPTPSETKAAIAAIKLLSTAFPAEANSPMQMFEKLIEVSRSSSLSENSEMEAMRLQMYMQKRQQMFNMLSNIMKQQNDTKKSIIGNLR
jgi:hypothetical protein